MRSLVARIACSNWTRHHGATQGAKRRLKQAALPSPLLRGAIQELTGNCKGELINTQQRCKEDTFMKFITTARLNTLTHILNPWVYFYFFSKFNMQWR
jgi:hypothetical protein